MTKTLTPGTDVKLAGWDHVTCASFDTVRHYCGSYGSDPEEAMERALACKSPFQS